jgi:hypothetical protein
MTKFNLDCARYVGAALEDDGYEGDVRETYSGRGMYGATCVAIVTDAGGVRIGELVAEYNQSSGESVCGPTRSDNMGLSYVYY